MRRFVDLHTHSTASDGSFSPSALVAMADKAELAAVGLTDHDTISGLAEARRAAEDFGQLCLVEGIEISAQWPGGVLHILGLAIDAESKSLRSVIDQVQAARAERNPKIVAKLQEMGIEIDMDDLVVVAAGVGSAKDTAETSERIISRLHIAQVLRTKGYVASIAEAFAKYIGADGPAYVDKERLSPRQAIAAIHDAGGLGIVAHPRQLGSRNSAQLSQALRDLRAAGIDGIEVYHTDHTPVQTRAYLELARRLGLGITGGSDFHGAAKPDGHIGRPRVPVAAMAADWAARLLGL